MDDERFQDGNINDLIARRTFDARSGISRSLQMHSSLIRRFSKRELEGHQGGVNTVAWNSKGSLLISGSDDYHVNIWNYTNLKLLYSIDTSHSVYILCAKFVPETSDELVVTGAGDHEVRLFNLSHSSVREFEESVPAPSALFQCHTGGVKDLAVEVGNPNIIWSASEDRTLRQHDLREVSSCPPAGSSHHECRCRSVLLNFQRGAKTSLVDPPWLPLALSSLDICSTRPHLLLVGGSDAFARLYDRRMLPSLSSCQTNLSPPPCVNYFCPVHLSTSGYPMVPLSHVSHVAFSPDGKEVLLSYLTEHVYLMDVNPAHRPAIRYTPEDASNLYSLTPVPNKLEVKAQRNLPVQLNKCRKLLQSAEKSLNDGANYYYGVEACNVVLDGYGHAIEPTIMHECLCTRAALLLKRNWINDSHMAIRDCQKARKIDPDSFCALLCMAKALLELNKHKEALDFAVAARTLAPSDSEVAVLLESIKEHNAAAEAKRGRSAVSNGNTIGSWDSPTLSPQNDRTHYQPEEAIDMKQRYVGHCNVGTHIKQACFLGQRGEYIASGSDDGRWFIWEKKSGRLVKVLEGDESAVYCVQCHPYDCVVATSGKDSTIKIWSPLDSVPSSDVVGGTAPDDIPLVTDVMENNQKRMSRDLDSLLSFLKNWRGC